MVLLQNIATTLLACTDTCAHEKLATLGLTAVGHDPGTVWRLIGVVGMSALVLSLLQCFRRRLGMAFLAFICGVGLLGMALGPGRHGWINHVKIRPMPFLGFSVTTDDEYDLSGPQAWSVSSGEFWSPKSPESPEAAEPLPLVVDRMGKKFWKLKDKQLQRELDDKRSILKRTQESHETARKAEHEAYREAAVEIRAYFQSLAAEHAEWAEREIQRNRRDLEKGIAELLNELRDTEHVEVFTESFGHDGKDGFRSAVRVQHPQDIARVYQAKAKDVFTQEVVPRGRRFAITGVSLVLLSILVYLAYLFVDTGTRGHFTWTLRIATVAAFVGICSALWYVVR